MQEWLQGVQPAARLLEVKACLGGEQFQGRIMVLKSSVDTGMTAHNNLWLPGTFWNQEFPLFNTAALFVIDLCYTVAIHKLRKQLKAFLIF